MAITIYLCDKHADEMISISGYVFIKPFENEDMKCQAPNCSLKATKRLRLIT